MLKVPKKVTASHVDPKLLPPLCLQLHSAARFKQTYTSIFAWKNSMQDCKCGILYSEEDKKMLSDRKAKKSGDKRIIGGESLTKNIYPWVVAIVHGKPNDGRLTDVNIFCGGTILTKNHVLTSAGCVKGTENQASEMFVTYGEYDQRMIEDGIDWTEVENIDYHPDYDPSTKIFDAAILTLKEEIDPMVSIHFHDFQY